MKKAHNTVHSTFVTSSRVKSIFLSGFGTLIIKTRIIKTFLFLLLLEVDKRLISRGHFKLLRLQSEQLIFISNMLSGGMDLVSHGTGYETQRSILYR